VIADPVTKKTDGRLARCTASNTCPKIFETNSANEYWSKDMAVGLVDAKGKDLTNMPANVRNYFISSMHHGGAFAAPGKGICQHARNPLTPNAILRALLVDMDEWVSKGTEPPASLVPSVAKGTLVPPLPQEKQGFPKLQGVTYNGRMHTGDLFDYGPEFAKGIMTVLPPKLVGTPYPALVPKTDGDGNDAAGIRMPDVAVPLRPIRAGRCAQTRPAAMTAATARGRSSPSPRPRRSAPPMAIRGPRSRSAMRRTRPMCKR